MAAANKTTAGERAMAFKVRDARAEVRAVDLVLETKGKYSHHWKGRWHAERHEMLLRCPRESSRQGPTTTRSVSRGEPVSRAEVKYLFTVASTMICGHFRVAS